MSWCGATCTRCCCGCCTPMVGARAGARVGVRACVRDGSSVLGRGSFVRWKALWWPPPTLVRLPPSPTHPPLSPSLPSLPQFAPHPFPPLLWPTDPTVLPLVLVALIGFASHKEHYALVASTEGLDVALHILHHFDLPFKRLAGACDCASV